MEWELFRRIIDEAGENRNSVKQIMPYLMNEPMLDRKIGEKIAYVRGKLPQAQIHIVTNGHLLDSVMTEKLLASPLDSLKISILAHRKDTYKRVMGVSDPEETIDRILTFTERAIAEKNNDFLSICLTRTPGEISDEEISEAQTFWKNRNVPFEINDPTSRAGNAAHLPKIQKARIVGCRSIWWHDMIHILFNGDVVLCCMDWRRKVVLGNLYKQTIREIWNGEAYNNVRQIIRGRKKGPSDFPCYKCEAAKIDILSWCYKYWIHPVLIRMRKG